MSNTESVTVGGKIYSVKLKNEEVVVEEFNADPHLFENDEDAVKILATPQEDTITNSGDNVKIDALAGNDTITNSGSNVLIYGGAGDDAINIYGANNVTVNGGDGNDTITIYNYDMYDESSAVNTITVEDFSEGDVIQIQSDTTILEVTECRIVSISRSGSNVGFVCGNV